MPRRPWVLTALAAVVLAVMVATGWVGTRYWGRTFSVGLLHGRVEWEGFDGQARMTRHGDGPDWYFWGGDGGRWEMGAEWGKWPPGNGEFRYCSVPLWVLVAFVAGLAGWRWRR
ncbi:MAG: hypothetical protein ACREJO_00490 [Phycisphaerales bacterium]